MSYATLKQMIRAAIRAYRNPNFQAAPAVVSSDPIEVGRNLEDIAAGRTLGDRTLRPKAQRTDMEVFATEMRAREQRIVEARRARS